MDSYGFYGDCNEGKTPWEKPTVQGYDRIYWQCFPYVGGILVEMVPYLTDNGDLGWTTEWMTEWMTEWIYPAWVGNYVVDLSNKLSKKMR